MQVQVINTEKDRNIDLEDVVEKVYEVLETTYKRLCEEHPEQNITAILLTEACFSFGFEIEGQEGIQVLSVEHHKGQPEAFKWIVDWAENANTTNEDSSFIDDWTASLIAGKPLEFETVESQYRGVEMEFLSSDAYGDMKKDTWAHPEGFRVVMVYQGDRLIQEYKLIPFDPDAVNEN